MNTMISCIIKYQWTYNPQHMKNRMGSFKHKYQDYKVTLTKSDKTFTKTGALWTGAVKNPNRMLACLQLMIGKAHNNDIMMLVY